MKNTLDLFYKGLVILLIVVATLVSCNNDDSDNKNNRSKDNKGYTINGNIIFQHTVDSVYLYEDGGTTIGRILSKAPVIDNKFTLTGTTDVPQKVLFGNINKEIGGELILENTDYTIDVEQVNLKIKGGEIHEKVLGFVSKPEYIALIADYNTKTNEFFKDVDMQNEKAVIAAREKADKLGDKVLEYESVLFHNIISDEKETTITKLFALLSTNDWERYPKEKRLELLGKYEAEIGEHVNIKKVKEVFKHEEQTIGMKASVKNGKTYKEVVAKDINGNSIALSELVQNNKYTLLEFWASWCAPCRAEIPNLKKAYKKYKGLGLEIYSVSIDSKRKKWEAALKEENAPWPNSMINGLEEKAQVDAYGVNGIPASYLIDENGTIVASNEELREFNLDRTLSKVFEK